MTVTLDVAKREVVVDREVELGTGLEGRIGPEAEGGEVALEPGAELAPG